jgi:hypothetical protein
MKNRPNPAKNGLLGREWGNFVHPALKNTWGGGAGSRGWNLSHRSTQLN